MRNNNLSILKRTFKLVRKFRGWIILSFLLGIIATPLALLKPLSLTILIDSGFSSKPLPGFISSMFTDTPNFLTVVIISCSLVVLIAILESIYGYVVWVLNTFIGEKLVLQLRASLFDHVQRLSLSYHDTKGTSYSSYHIQWDSVAVRALILGNLLPLVTSFISLVAMIGIMFYINWNFALIALSILPPLIILTKISSNRIRKDWDKVKQQESSAISVVDEVLSSVRIVKAFGQEINESKRFEKKANTAVKGQMKIAKIAGFYSGITTIILAIGTAGFIYLGANFVSSGKMTVGELTLVLAYLALINSPLENIIKILNNIQSSFSSLDRVFTLLDHEKEVIEDPNSLALIRAEGNVRFKSVSFGYKKDSLILNNVSFEIIQGDRVGIIGTTGAGKSTLISLLTRFYDCTDGEILIDEVNIKRYKLSDYRNQFSIVLQDPVLFSTTIRENILYGKSDATEKELVDAAKAANAHDFIIKFPEGYDTIVGERGSLLSGGERQRISIARAFIKNAPILILDEPTSSIDIKTEKLIMEAMERLMSGKTTFMITHRLDTLKSCNIILKLEHGKIAELIKKNDINIREA